MSGLSTKPSSSSDLKSKSSSKDSTPTSSQHALNYSSPDDLEMIKTIGTGTFGRVLLCKSKKPVSEVVNLLEKGCVKGFFGSS